MGRDVRTVVRGRERPHPRVEQLDHVGACASLRGDVPGEGVSELREQRVPDIGLAEHQALRQCELPARLPLDQVPGDGERATAEADDSLVGPQGCADEPDCLQHGSERLLRLRDAEPFDVGQRAHGLVDHGADALDEADIDAHAQNRGHDVGEHHGSVDVVAPHRLQRHLGAQIGGMCDVEECMLLAQGAILGK